MEVFLMILVCKGDEGSVVTFVGGYKRTKYLPRSIGFAQPHPSYFPDQPFIFYGITLNKTMLISNVLLATEVI
jgi:hypothetical protein